MTPELMEAGASALERHRLRAAAPSGDASFGRLVHPQVPDFAHGVALYLDEITVSFDGFRALNALSLAIDVGELRCIIGPNGAGKTTMMDVVTGKTRPDSGQAHFGSHIDLLRLREPEIVRAGICRKFQKPTVYEELTVFENLELALADDRGVRASLFARLSASQRERIAEILQLVHLLPEARRHAELLAARPISSLVAVKRTMTEPLRAGIDAARERENMAFAELMGGPANLEALTAFAEGREPDFTSLPPGW